MNYTLRHSRWQSRVGRRGVDLPGAQSDHSQMAKISARCVSLAQHHTPVAGPAELQCCKFGGRAGRRRGAGDGSDVPVDQGLWR